MARLVIHDLTTQYPRIDQMLANLPNAFFSGFDQARERQLKSELGDLTKQKTQLELAALGQNMQSQAAADQAWQSIMGGSSGSRMPSLGDLGGAANAIAGIESGGRYDALGPVTKTGDRAYGKYQVMGSNIPVWTEKYLGRRMTPEEFLASPEAQEAVFKGEFGRLAQKYGPEGAARAWFAGEGGMNDPNRRDILGTSVADYGRKFSERLGGVGGAQPVQVAQAPAASVGGVAADVPAEGAVPVQGFAIPQGAAPVQSGYTILPHLSTEQLQQLKSMRGQPKERQDLIDMALKERQELSKPTDAMRGYLFARQQGYTGTFMDYQQELRRAGATNVNIDRGETKYDEEMGKQFAQLNKEIIDGAADGRRKIAVLSRLEGILSDPNVYTGAGANLVLQAKRMAKAMGFDVGDLSGPEAINAISNQFALELRNPSGGAGMPGALSDKDREFLQQSVPGLERTPGANRIIIDYMRRMAQRSVEVDQLRRDYIRENKRLDEGFYDRLAEWSAANPLFTPADEAAVAQALGAGPRQGQPGGAQQGTVAPPPPGTVMDGYRFRGGDPADPNSWERVR